MRLSKIVVAERETFVRELFRNNNTMTGTEAQRRIKEQFGTIMRPNRIYELRTEVLAALNPPTTPTVSAETTTAVVEGSQSVPVAV